MSDPGTYLERGNDTGSRVLLPTVEHCVLIDLDAFDQLIPPLRQAVRDFPVELSAVEILAAWEAGRPDPGASVFERLGWWLEQFERRAAQILAQLPFNGEPI